MKKFNELEKSNPKEIEEKVNKYWDEINILNKTIEEREEAPSFIFYEGPPTANNLPGIHHVIARDLKDSFCKYKTMQGYKVLRKAGWDTHGLPVELEVEKQLGLNDKTEIEKYGIKEFNQKCKESVWTYKERWEEMTRQMGYFIDMENPYITFDNNYIETEWWILKEFFKAGLIYQGHKIVPFCTRCGTALASHEIAQGYQEDTVTTVTVPMKLKEDDAYLLVWTTTPWTLLANTAVCVNPNETYVKAESLGYKFIVAEKLLEKVLGQDAKVLETYKGTDLEYKEYEQLMPFINFEGKTHYITCDEYVTTEDGTGIVHLAPAFGAEDYEVCKKYALPVVNPVNEQGKYTEGPWKDMLVFDADKEVIKWLKENDKLFKKEQLKHNYPHCWRCKTPLLYYTTPSWYIKMTDLKDELVANNKTVNWFPTFVGEKRFGNWLENVNDWALSRTRYWGTPLNIWKCECGHLECIGSRKELVEKSIEQIDENVELHRPYVDDIHIKCEKCGKTMHRTPEVIDCWFDSGAMPFAQHHYPFENKENFDKLFPADFICEGIDQTRGWFYSLLAISTFIMKKSPYKNVLVNDLLLDKYGQKMSKSKGNGVNPFELFEKYGADACRWYLVSVSPVWTPTKFDEDGLKETCSKFFGTLKNTYTFFQLYANADEIDPREYNVDYEELEDIDKWLLSKYNNLIKNVTNEMEKYDLNKTVHLVQDFVCDDLSNWYIRRNRRRFWDSELNTSKKAVYQTTYEILIGISKLIAPIVPFLSEEMYRNLTGETSVHLSKYPECDETKIDTKLEEKMDLVIELISYARSAREDSKIKVRQPISEVIFEEKYKEKINEFENLFKEELNVKSVIWASDMSKYAKVSYKPNFKEVGKLFASNIKEFTEKLQNLTDDEQKALENGELKLNLGGNEYNIESNYVIKNIEATNGYNVIFQGYKTVAINTELTEDLIDEGIAREIVSKVQNLRKTNEFDIADRINVIYEAPKEIEKAIEKHLDYIKEEVLAITFEKGSASETIKINDFEMKISIEKSI
ncbi:MAG: isoleucine--tRNA ligase [Bacilli bacterium]|nr:isoleucine--tRNA ligase [Bacilli bacterium]